MKEKLERLKKAPDGKPVWAGMANEKYKVLYTHDGSTYDWWEVWDTEKDERVCTLQSQEAADFVVDLIRERSNL